MPVIASRPAIRIAAALTVCVTVSLAGCSGGDAPSSADVSTTDPSTSPEVTLSSFETVKPWNQVEGTDGRQYIADEWGRALQFRGVNIKTADPAADVSEEVLSDVARRGFNHIRLSVYWSSAEPTKDQYDDTYLADVDTAIERAAKHGLWVIVDFHQDVFGEAFAEHGIPKWATLTDGQPFADTGSFITNYLQPAVQAAWENLYEDPTIRDEQIEWYTDFVTRVYKQPNILGYDLLNEPFGKIRDGEDLISAARRVEAEQLTPMYQRLTDAVRKIDEDRWIFIEPPNLASLGVTTSLGRINAERVALYPHMYDGSIESQVYNGDGNPLGYDKGFIDKWAKAITGYTDKYPVPMFVGEWGLATPENEGLFPFVAESLAKMEEVTSGWSHFNGCRGEGYCTFAADGSDRPGIGQLVQPWVRAYGGRPDHTQWNGQTKVLSIAVEPQDDFGSTEIVIPPGVYDDGFEVATPDGKTADRAVRFTAPMAQGGFDVVNAIASDFLFTDTGDLANLCIVPKGKASTCTR